jgi:hypothetical protein
MNIIEKYNKILYVKIPKNGTHSINNFLKKNNLDNWNRKYFFEHDPLYVLEKNNILDNNTFIFCVSRNPYTRFFSQYNQLVRTFSGYLNKTNIDFCLDIKNKKLHPVFVSPQVSWISEEKNNILPIQSSFYDMNRSIYDDYDLLGNLTIIDIDKIYKLENIHEFEDDFETKLSVYNKSNCNILSYKKFFTKDVIDFVINYYKIDFLYFDYSFDFNLSIKKYSFTY